MGTEVPINRFGLTEVASSKPAGVDVVFVHGLNGDPQKTWTADKSRTFWPSQLLPPILEEEHTRILVYGYDADVSSFTDGASRDKIHNHAEHLVAELAANRRIRRVSDRPIIFLAHSLGGLVVKRALIYSSEIRGTKTEHLRSIFVSTYGILFLGTPHKGSDLAKWGSRLERICSAVMPKKVVDTNSSLVNALKENNETLQNIDRQFIQIMSKFHIFFFHEAKPTDLKGTMEYIVDEESASPTVQDVERAAIQADHSHMCKFENDNAPGFDLVVEAIQRYAEQAPSQIKGRWAAEEKERVIQKEAAVEELIPGSVKGSTPQSDSISTFDQSPGSSQILNPSKTSKPEVKDDATTTADPPARSEEPYFIVPPGFRANTFFVGMEKEHQELDRRLFDKRRKDGTACVLLYGQPGGGKSHLARQYVNKNRKKFEGGIFWISAKSREERDHAFWDICQKVVARDKPDMCIDGHNFVDTVRLWFESRHDWLLVFDGVTLDADEDATDLQKFIPDSRNASLIYISRAKNLESKQRLLRPHPIRVSGLQEEDARKLLFKELHMDQPKDAEVKKASELVKKIGGLPLAIDAIAHKISDTHEPLVKFSIKSYSADATMGGTYNPILGDLQKMGHMEAWNLLHILCFFGQRIPVELLHLGLKSLRHDNVEVQSSADGAKPDINTTFSILMKYALVSRNEPDDSSMSSSRDSLVGPEPIDVLKIHGVVQKLCCDSLSGMNILPRWLGYAVRLFAYSFHQADVRIKTKPQEGRVSDYREYLTHGQRLWDSSHTYSSNAQPLDDVRAYLTPVMNKISEEIRVREPSSSQESVSKGVFQISIFDRTSSSSESNPSASETRTPEHRPSPLPLENENLYGIPLEKSALDSPRSFGTTTPPTSGYPRIVGGSPRFPPYDDGYESEREQLSAMQKMQRTPSDTTARPPDSTPRPPELATRPRAPTAESDTGGWQVVPSRKPRSSRRRRDLGSFRPTPARAQVDRRNVTGYLGRSEEENKQRASSDAFSSLAEVQQKSPPASKESGIGSFFHRGSSRKLESADTQPSWANIAAEQAQSLPQPQQQSQDTPSPAAMIMERGRSRESVRGNRQGNVQRSPLASEFIPSRNGSYEYPRPATSQGLQYPNHPAVYPPPEPILSDPYVYASQPPLGLNRTPYPLYENIPPPTKPPLPTTSPHREISPLTQPPTSAYHSPPSRHSQSPHSPYSTAYSPPSPYSLPLPTGYTSAPMSRDTSHQSHASLAATEPPRYIAPSQPLYHPLNASFSPRDRGLDGRPLRKSPKTAEYAVSVPQPSPQIEDPNYPAHYHNQTHHASLPSIYDSAIYYPHQQGSPSYHNPLGYPTSQHSSPGAAISRSSSGPGLALESPGAGLGIVRFDPAGRLQFGEMDAVSLEDARRRTGEWGATLREEGGFRNGGRGREGGTPYPDVNLMPTVTNEGALGRMTEQGVQS